MMENIWLKEFTEHGVPTLLLAAICWLLVRPVIKSFINNIDKQTNLLSVMAENCNNMYKEIHETNLKSTQIISEVENLKEQFNNIKAK